MLRSFDGLALRQLRTRRLRALLTGFGIVLGVGMVFGVLLLAGTIRHTFDALISSAYGRTDVIALSSSGGQIPEAKLAATRAVEGVRDVAPMVGAILRRLDDRDQPISGQAGRMMVAGIDPGNAPYDFRFSAGGPARSGRVIAVEEHWAERRGLRLGDVVRVDAPAGRVELRIVGVFHFTSGLSFGEQGIAAVPMATARRIFVQPTGYMQLSIQAADRTQVPALQRRLERVLGPGVQVMTPQGFSDDVARQFESFNVVLYFFSSIALFVGGFLILNSFNMTVLQRMREIGMLRTLGATRGMVTRTVLTEALAIGGVGTLLGLGLGLALSAGLLAMIGGLGIPTASLTISAGPVAIAVALGLVASALGALWPARRAGRIAPVRAVLGTADVRRRPRARRALIGVALFVPGLLLGGRAWFSGNGSDPTGIPLTMAMFVGMAMAAPYVILPVLRALAVPMRWLLPSSGRLAADSALSNPSRTAATAMALTIGLSVVVVNNGMSASFLGTISDQLDAAYARDFTIQPEGQSLGVGGQVMSRAVARRVAALPDAGTVTPVRTTLIDLPGMSTGQPGLVMGVDPAGWAKVDRTPMSGATREAALTGLARGGVIAGRSFAEAAGLRVGSRVVLDGPAGSRPARVVGVLDATGGGLYDTMHVSLDTMRDVYGIAEDSQLAVVARTPAARAALGRELATLLRRDYPSLEVLATADVKDQIKGEIDRQFALFNAILVIAVIVSLLGVVNTLAMSVLERTREIGVLRALGASRWLVRRTMLDESLLITGAGAVAGVVLGGAIAFAWVQALDALLPGIRFRFPVLTGVGIVLGAVVLGALAAVVPARRAARLDPIRAIGYE